MLINLTIFPLIATKHLILAN